MSQTLSMFFYTLSIGGISPTSFGLSVPKGAASIAVGDI